MFGWILKGFYGGQKLKFHEDFNDFLKFSIDRVGFFDETTSDSR